MPAGEPYRIEFKDKAADGRRNKAPITGIWQVNPTHCPRNRTRRRYRTLRCVPKTDTVNCCFRMAVPMVAGLPLFETSFHKRNGRIKIVDYVKATA